MTFENFREYKLLQITSFEEIEIKKKKRTLRMH